MNKTLYGNPENRMADDSQWDDEQGLNKSDLKFWENFGHMVDRANAAFNKKTDIRTKELIDIHTQDIDDMLAELMENHPDQALEILQIALNPGFIDMSDIMKQRHWFLREFIQEQCEKLAEKEFDSE